MKKVKLTVPWKNDWGYSSEAWWNDICLRCEKKYHNQSTYFVGIARLSQVIREPRRRPRQVVGADIATFRLVGNRRLTVARARRDAEQLAIEILLGIRDGSEMLMKQYGITEDD